MIQSLPFIKMHGLGNDFVVIDARDRHVPISATFAQAIANRKTGVGCDQLLIIEPPADGADAAMRIRNSDGSEAAACGNGARCVAALLMQEKNVGRIAIESEGGLLIAEDAGPGRVTIDMGPARLDWREIPLSRPMDTLRLDLAAGPLRQPVAVNVGNPHIVFFVPDAEAVNIAELGPELEHNPLFPGRVNVEVANLIEPDRLRMRVWERGAGITRACGTGACATLVAAARRGLTGRRGEVVLDGGSLDVEWLENGHVRMTGPVAWSFSGTLDDRLLG